MKILWSAIFFSVAFTVYSQVSFTAKANRTTVGKNEEFTVEFRVNARGKDFSPPNFANFRVLGGPNTSFSSYMDNSGIRQVASYSFILRPVKEGTFTIGPATIRAEGEVLKTEPLTITITPQSQKPSNPNDPRNIAAENVFLRVTTNKTSLYQGEPLVASYKIYFGTDISNPELLEEPEYTGFYRQEVDLKRITTRKEKYQGKDFTSAMLRQMVLIPQSSGKIKPGTIEYKVPIQVPSGRRDIFGRPIGRRVNLNISENFPQLEVKPLPSANQPSDFSGAVGDFKIDVSVNRTEVTTDESVTLKVKISGSGNLKLLEIPEPEIPNAFEVYDPKFSEKISVGITGMNGHKAYEYLLIPRYNGDYKIPSIKFVYFDPAEGKYKLVRSDEIVIKVSGGEDQPSKVEGGKQMAVPGKENVDFINEDILSVKNEMGTLKKKGKYFYGSSLYYGLLIGVVSAFSVILAYFFLIYNRKEDHAKLRKQKASKLARKHLGLAKKELNNNKKEAFYTALSNAIWGYFSDKLNVPKSKMSKEVIIEKLTENGIDTLLVEKVSEIMNKAELARFTSISDSDPARDYENTRTVIIDIEKQL